MDMLVLVGSWRKVCEALMRDCHEYAFCFTLFWSGSMYKRAGVQLSISWYKECFYRLLFR